MEPLEKSVRSALPSQLLAAIDETPGLVVPVLMVFVCLEVFGFGQLFPHSAGTAGIYALEAILSVLFGTILYAGGGFWDEVVFKRLYEPSKGTLCKHDHRFLGVLPAGKPLETLRENAAEALHGDRAKIRGIYADSEDLVRSSDRWMKVEGPLVISKLVRSFIWPALLIGLVFLGAAVLHRSGLFAGIGIVCFMLVPLSLVPYLEFRVRHMSRLYRTAERLAISARQGAPGDAA